MSRSSWVKEPDASLICAAYEAGQKVEAIAASFGVHASSIRNIARRKGAKIRPVGRDSSARDAEITAEYLSGSSAVEIAARLKVSRQTAYNAIRRRGEVVRPRWVTP